MITYYFLTSFHSKLVLLFQQITCNIKIEKILKQKLKQQRQPQEDSNIEYLNDHRTQKSIDIINL